MKHILTILLITSSIFTQNIDTDNKTSNDLDKKYKYCGKMFSKEEYREKLMNSGLRWMMVGNFLHIAGGITVTFNQDATAGTFFYSNNQHRHSNYWLSPIFVTGLFFNSIGLRKLNKAWSLK